MLERANEFECVTPAWTPPGPGWLAVTLITHSTQPTLVSAPAGCTRAVTAPALAPTAAADATSSSGGVLKGTSGPPDTGWPPPAG